MRQLWHKMRGIAAIGFLCLLFGAVAIAQDPADSKPRADAASEQEVEPASHDHRPHLGRELAKESREAAGEDENAEFKHSASVQKVAQLTGMSTEHAYWLCLLVNFGIVAALIIWASAKNLPGFFRSRTSQIQQAMEEARRASADANQRLSDIGARLSRLDGEIAAMRAAADKEAAAEEERIKLAAEEDGRKIIQAAEQEIAAATKAARRELTAHAASLAVSLAAKQIRVDANADQALVREFAAQLAADGKPRTGDN